jgi:hypothetical protein
MSTPPPPAKRLRSMVAAMPKRQASSNANTRYSSDASALSSSKRTPVPVAKRRPVATPLSADKRKADSVQLSLGFTQRDPYPAGMKFLLPETIYPNAALVST